MIEVEVKGEQAVPGKHRLFFLFAQKDQTVDIGRFTNNDKSDVLHILVCRRLNI